MATPLHFVSFYSGQEFFVGSNGFPNPASHLFVGDVVFVRDAKETSETSHFPLSVSFSLFLLLMSKSHKNIKIWTWPGSATVWFLSWGLCSCRPRWSWALWVLLWFGQSWSVFRHGSLVNDYGSQIFEALNGFQLLAIDPDVTADAISVVGHQFGLLSTDLHAACGRSLVKALNYVS